MEQRKAIRFSLLAPVIYRYKNGSGQKKENMGGMRNISILGAFIVCQDPPPIGTALSLEIDLPALERNSLQRLKLKAKARVLRVTASDQESGFAVSGSFELYEA